jgi:hypothetical protein
MAPVNADRSTVRWLDTNAVEMARKVERMVFFLFRSTSGR